MIIGPFSPLRMLDNYKKYLVAFLTANKFTIEGKENHTPGLALKNCLYAPRTVKLYRLKIHHWTGKLETNYAYFFP